MDQDQLKAALKSYKYVSPNLSLLERLYLNRLWELFAKCYPRWLAPNLITLSGFICFFVAFLVLLFHDPLVTGSTPTWTYFFIVLCCFLYQSLDGSDGKQARNTKTGSPLGELFDHGVDAMTAVMYTVLCNYICALPFNSAFYIISFIASIAAFFTSNLTLLHTNRQIYNELDAQEAQVVIQVLIALVGFIGRDMYNVVIPLSPTIVDALPKWLFSDFIDPEGNGLKTMLLLPLCTSCAFLNCFKATFKIVSHVLSDQSTELPEGRGLGSLVLQIVSFKILTIFIVLSWYQTILLRGSDEDVTLMATFFFVSVWAFGDFMNHTLCTRVGHLPFPAIYRNRAIWMMFAFCAVNYLALQYKIEADMVFALRWTVVIAGAASNLQYCYLMGQAITSALGIKVFTIPYDKKKA